MLGNELECLCWMFSTNNEAPRFGVVQKVCSSRLDCQCWRTNWITGNCHVRLLNIWDTFHIISTHRMQELLIFQESLNPSHPNISFYILHTVLYKFPKALTRRLCLKIMSSCTWWSFPLFPWLGYVNQRWCSKENLDACHSEGLKVWWLLSSCKLVLT